MPRGGDNGNDTNGHHVAKELYYQELSEEIIKSDDAAASDEMELVVNNKDDCDVEAYSDESDTSVSDGDDELIDELIEERNIPKFLSPQHLTTTLPSNLIHFASMVIQVARRSLVAGARAILVENVDEPMHEDEAIDVEEDKVASSHQRRPMVRTLVGKTVYVLGEMYHAAKMTTSTTAEDVVQSNDGGNNRTHRRRRRRRSSSVIVGSPSRRHHRKRERYTTRPTEVVCNGGGMGPNNNNALLDLAQRHNINLPTDNDTPPKKYDSILLNSQTPLSAALQKSNSDARFLICYISKPTKKGSIKKADSTAFSSLFSPEVVKFINRRPLGKKQSDTTGSYYVWIMNGDDGAATKEIEMAMKRLKVKPPTSSSKKSSSKKKKEDGPILAIFYPATTIDSSGKLKVTPRLLAQHHCHPPPSSPEVMMNWANTIRKRHIREFAKLQHDRKEMQLLKERTEGYKESMKEDKAREEREERELQAKKAAEEKERLRLEALEQRRQELLEALPEEPEAGSEGVITIALRFADGSRDQRRFLAEETFVNDLLNWVDAMHGMEREKIELSTMNGSKTLVYVEEEDDEESGNVTLAEAGLGKMTALRVNEIVEEVQDNDEEEEDEEEEEYESESSEEEEE